jgi:hypothetical protein
MCKGVLHEGSFLGHAGELVGFDELISFVERCSRPQRSDGQVFQSEDGCPPTVVYTAGHKGEAKSPVFNAVILSRTHEKNNSEGIKDGAKAR